MLLRDLAFLLILLDYCRTLVLHSTIAGFVASVSGSAIAPSTRWEGATWEGYNFGNLFS